MSQLFCCWWRWISANFSPIQTSYVKRFSVASCKAFTRLELPSITCQMACFGTLMVNACIWRVLSQSYCKSGWWQPINQLDCMPMVHWLKLFWRSQKFWSLEAECAIWKLTNKTVEVLGGAQILHEFCPGCLYNLKCDVRLQTCYQVCHLVSESVALPHVFPHTLYTCKVRCNIWQWSRLFQNCSWQQILPICVLISKIHGSLQISHVKMAFTKAQNLPNIFPEIDCHFYEVLHFWFDIGLGNHSSQRVYFKS